MDNTKARSSHMCEDRVLTCNVNITKVTEPWIHYTAQNFFPDELLHEIEKHFMNDKDYEPWTGYGNRMGKSIEMHSPLIYSYLCDTITPKFMGVCKDELLERNLPIDASKYDVFHAMYCIDGIGYSVPVHTDILQKCMTFIVYINGKGSCTSLLKTIGGKHFDRKIIPNSALVFVPQENTTYHTVIHNTQMRHTIQFTIQLKKD
jgi:hypothetical protein